MKRVALSIALLCGGAHALAASPAGPWTDFFDTPHDVTVPRDVQNWVIRTQGCGHFAGEVDVDDDRQRAAYLKRQMAKLCPGLKAKRASLTRKYQHDPAVQAIVKETWDAYGQD